MELTSATLANILRQDRGRLLAALIALLHDFDLAEDALADAAESALVHWGRSGVPTHPQGWLLRVAGRKAIDRIRRKARWRARQDDIALLAAADMAAAAEPPPEIPDARLRLIFTCCHPALDPKTRVALTLRTLGGLTTAEIARAFLDEEPAMGQRLSRAKAKIATAGIPFVVPGPDQWADRLTSVLAVIYLIFNEGYSANAGAAQIRADLCGEAIWLARLMAGLCPAEAEAAGLLALLLLTDARRQARTDAEGRMVTLDRQDRALWQHDMIREGTEILNQAMRQARPGPFQIKAAIAALHAAAPTHAETDWAQVAALYDALLRHEPTAVVRLNRAMAQSEAGGRARSGTLATLAELETLAGQLDGYQPYHAALAEILSRLGDSRALVQYSRAISLSGSAAQRDFLRERKDLVAQTQKKGRDKLGQSPTGR